MKRKILALLCALTMLFSLCGVFASPATAADTTGSTKWLTATGNTPSADEYDYSFVLVGDTQMVNYLDTMMKNGKRSYPSGYENGYLYAMYNWIAQNKDSKKIAHVFGLGDITDRDYMTSVANRYPVISEWTNAANAVALLDAAGVSYSMARGNHDNSVYMNNALNTSAYRAQYSGGNGGFSPYESLYVPHVETQYPHRVVYTNEANGYMENSWKIIEAGSETYLLITLDSDPSEAMLTWASDLITTKTALYPNLKVTISTHAYLNPLGDRTTSPANSKLVAYGAQSPTDLYNKLVAKHDNIVFVFGGHYVDGSNGTQDPIVLHQTTRASGNILTEILCDPQGLDKTLAMPGIDGGANSGNDFSASGYPIYVPSAAGNFTHPTNTTGGDFACINGSKPAGLVTMLYFMKDGSLRVEYYSPIRDAYWGTENQRTETRDMVGVIANAMLTTSPKASVRISPTHTGLRFKTAINKTYIDNLVASGKTVNVGTLIVPYDTLVLLPEFTEAVLKTYGVKYLDVPATVSAPFATEGGNYIYAGSITNLKPENLTRDFAAIGYIEINGVRSYAEAGYTTRNAYDVATVALNDTSATFSEADGYVYEMTVNGSTVYSPYTAAQRTILQTILNTADGRDPFGKDEF